MRELLNHLNSNEIQCRPFWTPMNNLPMYKDLNILMKMIYQIKYLKSV